jgi:hypothetical protein
VKDQKIEKEKLSVYPNPNKGRFRIDFNKREVNNFDLQVVDKSGKTVHRKTYTGSSQRIDLSHLPPGIYYCYLTAGAVNETFKLLIN